MKNKNNISPNHEKSGSFLEQIKKETPFSVPKNYFESLHHVINDKKLENNNIKNIFDNLSYRILAPALGVLSIITIIYIQSPDTTENELTSEQISEMIIDENLYEFDEYLIYDVYSETQTQTSSTENSDEEVIEYLIDNNISINSIIEEL